MIVFLDNVTPTGAESLPLVPSVPGLPHKYAPLVSVNNKLGSLFCPEEYAAHTPKFSFIGLFFLLGGFKLLRGDDQAK